MGIKLGIEYRRSFTLSPKTMKRSAVANAYTVIFERVLHDTMDQRGSSAEIEIVNHVFGCLSVLLRKPREIESASHDFVVLEGPVVAMK